LLFKKFSFGFSVTLSSTDDTMTVSMVFLFCFVWWSDSCTAYLSACTFQFSLRGLLFLFSH
jgi:hypothetical protein